MNDIVSAGHAARIIGVSPATIRNWSKTGHITPASSHPLSFLKETVLNLKALTGSESFGKLKTRANKSGSTNSFLPEEYAENLDMFSHIATIVRSVKEKNLETTAVMFLAALRFLEARGEVVITGKGRLFSRDSYSCWARESVKSVMMEWLSTFTGISDEAGYNHIYELVTPFESDDFLGLFYQGIFREGDKSRQGSYFTPTNVVEESLTHFTDPLNTFMDPCCGTGKYLLRAAKKFHLLPENIFGFDADTIAVNIAKINLLMAYQDREFSPNIRCLDSLSELATGEIYCETNELLGKIDAIATNPPWGACKNLKTKRSRGGKIKSGETFSLFLEKSMQLLRTGGRLSFILPESVLKIKVHADIREFILNKAKIRAIALLGRCFTGVFTPVIRLDILKESAPDGWLVSVEQGSRTGSIPQERFKKNDHFTFDVTVEAHEEAIVRKIYSTNHCTLAKNARWALGIVTGDNKRYVNDTQQPGMEALFRGSDVFYYSLGEPKCFIHFTPRNFQQVAPEELFRVPEKLIYKFISSKLVFAFDDKQRLTLNSANIVIPSLPGMSVKVALAFLNSSVFRYLFRKKFSSHKVLRGDLEKLPFPVVNQEIQKNIERYVDCAIETRKTPEELEHLIYSLFGLDTEDVSVISQAV